MPSLPESFIDEIEAAVNDDSPEKRVATLRKITDLFLHGANQLTEEQIGVFDDVLCRITEGIEKAALAELGKRLAPVDNAPIDVVRRLAKDEEIAVAAPILTGSNRLTTPDLVEIARIKGQAHLLAISERRSLEPVLTDVLLDRGNRNVVSKLATNAGARFSDSGFNKLVDKAQGDDRLTEIVGLRNDLPTNMLRELLQRATEAAKAKILAASANDRRDQIRQVIEKIGQAVAAGVEHDYSRAEAYVRSLEAAGRLNEETLLQLVRKHQRDEMVAALARLCSAASTTIGELLLGQRNDAVLIPCRAADLKWPTVEAILHNRRPEGKVSELILDRARNDYSKLTKATAQRILRFMQIRNTVK